MDRKLIFGLMFLMISTQLIKCEEEGEEKEEDSSSEENTSLPSISIKEFITSEKITISLKTQCYNETGSDDAYENSVLPELNKFSKDFTDALNITTLYRENFDSKDNTSTFIRKACKNHNEALDTLEEFSKTLAVCFDATMGERIRSGQGYLRKQINAFCENDAIKLTTFIDDDGPLCLQDSRTQYNHCLHRKLQKLTPEDVRELKQTNECYVLQQYKDCLVKATQHACEKPTTSQLIDSIFQLIQSEAQCSNIDWLLMEV